MFLTILHNDEAGAGAGLRRRFIAGYLEMGQDDYMTSYFI